MKFNVKVKLAYEHTVQGQFEAENWYAAVQMAKARGRDEVASTMKTVTPEEMVAVDVNVWQIEGEGDD